MIVFYTKPEFIAHKKYVVEELISAFIEEVCILKVDESITGFTVSADGLNCNMPDVFFGGPGEWLTEERVPKDLTEITIEEPYKNFGRSSLPLLFGSVTNNTLTLKAKEFGIDIIGSLFFLLSRYEELVIRERDRHGRVPSGTLLSERYNFSHFPLLNYYLVWFVQYLNHHLKLSLKLKDFSKFYLTLDIDHPSTLNLKTKRTAKVLIKDLIVYRDLKAFGRRLYAAVFNKVHEDPYNFIPLLKRVSGTPGMEVVIFFMNTGTLSTKHDERYAWSSRFMQYYLEKCIKLGAHLGLHPSYSTGDSKEALEAEMSDFVTKVKTIGYLRKSWIRHHYLRFNPHYSYNLMSQNGFDFDSTVGFEDLLGFKSSICFPYKTFDLLTGKSLNTVEVPFMVMDRVLISENLSFQSSAISELVDEVKKFKGVFTYLAHNCELGYQSGRNVLNKTIEHYYGTGG